MAEEKGEVKIVWKGDREALVGESRIYLGEDNIIYYTGVGEDDEQKALMTKEAHAKFVSMVPGKAHVLVDLSKAGKASPEARKTWKKLTENEKTGKVALFGMDPVARVLASFVMGVSGNKDMRFFKTREEALAWLKE